MEHLLSDHLYDWPKLVNLEGWSTKCFPYTSYLVIRDITQHELNRCFNLPINMTAFPNTVHFLSEALHSWASLYSGFMLVTFLTVD